MECFVLLHKPLGKPVNDFVPLRVFIGVEPYERAQAFLKENRQIRTIYRIVKTELSICELPLR